LDKKKLRSYCKNINEKFMLNFAINFQSKLISKIPETTMKTLMKSFILNFAISFQSQLASKNTKQFHG